MNGRAFQSELYSLLRIDADARPLTEFVRSEQRPQDFHEVVKGVTFAFREKGRECSIILCFTGLTKKPPIIARQQPGVGLAAANSIASFAYLSRSPPSRKLLEILTTPAPNNRHAHHNE